MTEPATVGELIRSMRTAANLTQSATAAAARVSVGTWSRTESGSLIPDPRRVASMAQAVSVTPEQLDAVGQGDAANLLRARRQSGQVPNPVISAIVQLQTAVMDHGWSVLMQMPEPDVYVIQLRRQNTATDEA